MIAVMCRSALMVYELRTLLAERNYCVLAGTDGMENHAEWLASRLKNTFITHVLYEPYFFTDPARFRILSPETMFIIMSSPGEERQTQKAFACGAGAVIHKPLVSDELFEVLNFAE
ncbi:hypothetical protein K7I13_00865 [Brucepastera parasyntrophica]|uniref:hypothetical protein n=1 Tax=Brucepastera parasyntrophica TaxID=2880008 RepID=UPI00210BA4A0|nr:hypothetical protein [Brucepastera parasyntrophica]ULQ59930.1 hypothetical protein K7I13_00865 [Brucepastera parasyntrophica]